MPIVTFTILIACVGFSMYAFSNRVIMDKYLFNAYAIKHYNQKYRFLSHAFIHADYGHLIINMYVLYAFGSMLEVSFFSDLFGKFSTLFYILLYTGGIYASSFADFIKHKNNPSYNAVGASGAVSALVFSVILLKPTSGMGIIFLPFLHIPSWVFGLLYLAYSFYMDRRKGDNIAHGAHAWGAVFGFFFTGILDLVYANPNYERVFVSFFEQIKESF